MTSPTPRTGACLCLLCKVSPLGKGGEGLKPFILKAGIKRKPQTDQTPEGNVGERKSCCQRIPKSVSAGDGFPFMFSCSPVPQTCALFY